MTGETTPVSDQPARFRFPFRVRYSEIDMQGIVFNAHYLTYFDTAITEYFRTVGYDYQGAVRRLGTDFHTVKSLVEYAKPIAFDEDILVGVRPGRIGRTSLQFALSITATDTSDIRATGEIVWVHTDQSTHTSTPLPPDLIDAIQAFEAAA